MSRKVGKILLGKMLGKIGLMGKNVKNVKKESNESGKGTFMAKTDGKLNAIELKKLEPGFHADGRGLYLDVQESGSRSWILRTMVRGRRKDIGLGGLAKVSLAEAREAAAD